MENNVCKLIEKKIMNENQNNMTKNCETIFWMQVKQNILRGLTDKKIS